MLCGLKSEADKDAPGENWHQTLEEIYRSVGMHHDSAHEPEERDDTDDSEDDDPDL